MDKTYDKPVVPDIPIKNQNLTDEALALIAYLNLNYWCKDAEEKEELKKKYIENEERYNEELRNHQHGADYIFKSNEKLENISENEITHLEKTNNEENEMIVYKKDNIFRRIWFRIKSKFL